jgi:RNA polymerase-binding transcription factor DksA
VSAEKDKKSQKVVVRQGAAASKAGAVAAKGGAPGKKVAGTVAAPAPPVKGREGAGSVAAGGVGPAALNGLDPKKPAPKGITIVSSKPMKRPRVKPKVQMPASVPLLKPGAKWKPLIPSGPKATPTGMVGATPAGLMRDGSQKSRPKLPKKELDKYRTILLRKRSELVGDVSNMEDEALRQSSGSLSHLPQHMAEQGTDAFDQAMSLDLAAVDRTLIREIDDALARIDTGTYGVCERTGVLIAPERLAELPWAKYSIEAARALERRPYQE